jgi:hypothetical protein
MHGELRMTPQERDLITSLLNRLKQAGGQPRDPEAESLIRQAAAEQPDVAYYLVQTVLIQDMALNQAQGRIADIENQLTEAVAQKQPTSFLGGIFGKNSGGTQTGRASVPPSGQTSQPPQSPPPTDPWNRPATQPGYAQPGFAQPMGGMAQPGYGQPGSAQPMAGMAQGGSGFLRSAATTAAGVAGGALLFEGVQSMFGHESGGILGGIGQKPSITETVTQNNYVTDPATGQTGAGDQNRDDGLQDASTSDEDGQDVDSDTDMTSDDDFGGGYDDDSDDGDMV